MSLASALQNVSLRSTQTPSSVTDASSAAHLASAVALEKRNNERLRAVDLESWYERLKEHTYKTVFVPITPVESRAIIKQYWRLKKAEQRAAAGDALSDSESTLLQLLEEKIADAMTGVNSAGNGVFAKLSSRSPKDSRCVVQRAGALAPLIRRVHRTQCV